MIVDTSTGKFITGISVDGLGRLVVSRADAYSSLWYNSNSGNVISDINVTNPKTELNIYRTTVPTNEEFDALKQQVAKAEQENADLKERLLKLEQLTQNLPAN